jgi:hypothetical protein
MRTRLAFSRLAFCAAFTAGHAWAQAPLNAIDWLEDPAPLVLAPQSPVAQSAAPSTVVTQPLDGPRLDGTGLISAQSIGLPQSFWGTSDPDDLIMLMTQFTPEGLPAVRDMVKRILLADLTPPQTGEDGKLFIARIDVLIRLGALDQASALIDQANTLTPAIMAKRFDLALLQGHEDRACQLIAARPSLSPTRAAQVFCLARAGEWTLAALTLDNAAALGEIPEELATELARFLDPDLAEALPPMPAGKMTPLAYRLADAMAEAPGTQTLPLAYTHLDLPQSAGWKAQITAAERLTRAGCIPPDQLLSLYEAQRPAASGGIWDRARAIQDLQSGLTRRDVGAVARSLPIAWDQLDRAGLALAVAPALAPYLADMPLTGRAGHLAFVTQLLTEQSETAARTRSFATPFEAALGAIAQGNAAPKTDLPPASQAVLAAFTEPPNPGPYMALLNSGKLGEASLRALLALHSAPNTDQEDITQALSFFRAIGMEALARQAGLQILLTEA